MQDGSHNIPETQQTLARIILEQGQRHGDKAYMAFTHEPGQAVRYGPFAQQCENAGSRLHADFKLEPGTAAAVFLANGASFVAAWGACQFAGLVDVAVNYEMKKALLAYALTLTGVRAIFTDASGLDRMLDEDLRAVWPQLELLVMADGTAADDARARLRDVGWRAQVVSLKELQQPVPARRAWEAVAPTALASIRYTSGSTGPAKGIMYSHLHILKRTVTHNRVMTLEQNDVLYSPFALYHGLGGLMGAVGTLQAGATMVGALRFSASRYWADAREHSATLGHILFTLIPMLLQQPPESADRAHKVRYLYTAWPHREFEERFATRLLQVYAQSEVGVIAFRRAGTEEGSRCVGPPLPELEVQVVDALDYPLPQDETGEIVVRPRRPHSTMLGYYNNAEATSRAFRNLWHHTGDGGYLNEAGELFFLGRLGTSIRRRGVNISSDQIDEEIIRHPQVLECATVGVPSELGEEEILCLVVWREPPADASAAARALAAFAVERLPKQHVPRFFEFTDALPRTVTGKVQKLGMQQRERGAVWDRELDRWAARTGA